jgi:O-antigen ligase
VFSIPFQNIAPSLSDGLLITLELFLGLGVVFGIFFYFTLRNTMVGLIGLLFLVLTHIHDLIETVQLVSIPIVLEVIILFSLVLRWIREQNSLFFIWPQSILLFVFICFAWASTLILGRSLYDISGRLLIKEFLVIFFIFIAIQNAVKDKKDFNAILRIIVLSGVTLCILCLVQTFITGIRSRGGFVYSNEFGGELVRQAGGMNWNPNAVAAFLAMIFPLPFFLLPWEKSAIFKTLYVVSIPLTILTIFLTYSRAGFLYLIITITLILSRRWKVRYTLGLLLVLLITFASLPEAFWARMETMATDRDFSGRAYLYSVAWKLFLENPLTGVGYGNSVFLMQPYTIDIFSGREGPHNLYLTILAETGLINFLIFSLLLLVTFFDLQKIRSYTLKVGEKKIVRICEAFLVSLIVFLAAGMAIDTLHSVLFYIYLALILVLKKRIYEWTLQVEPRFVPA